MIPFLKILSQDKQNVQQFSTVKPNLYTNSNDYCALYRQSAHHRKESEYNDWIIRVIVSKDLYVY